MLDINELIKELSVSVKQVIVNDWNPKNISNNKAHEYSNLVLLITVSTIENFNEEDLQKALFNLEKETIGIDPNIERCKRVAKQLTNARNSHHAKLIYKGRRERREKMAQTIKEIVVPFLRKKGFKGSFPNFKLEIENQTVNLRFQFSQFSSQFVVELKSLKSGKERLRLGSIKYQKDYWYDFEKNSNSVPDIFKIRAQEVIDNWEEAENWIEK